jgi:hypothetical protein
MPHLRKSCRSSRGSTKSSGPNTALEATGHSVRFVAGVGLYPLARPWQRTCLGLSFTRQRPQRRRVSEQALQALKD